MKRIDSLLNHVTMYRLLVYGLGLLSVYGLILASIGRISYSPLSLVLSLVMIVASSYFVDSIFARVWNIPNNSESWLITSLILFLLLEPTNRFPDILYIFLGSLVASASKYIVVWRGRHIFNPAAFAAAFFSLTAFWPVVWWVGGSAILPIAVVLGFLVVRKIRRLQFVFVFLASSVLVQAAVAVLQDRDFGAVLQNMLVSSPLIFFGTIMVTEPATMPSRKRHQMIFAVFVAALAVWAPKIGPVKTYPEVALLIGNIFAFAVMAKGRAILKLVDIQKISDRVYDYIFEATAMPRFSAGQYMEWTLPNVGFDSRGNRRTLTIASSPTEKLVHLGVKFYDPSSEYKKTLQALRPGSLIYGSHVGGDFTLPKDPAQKLIFIAGGIGVTPFRSMLKFISDQNERRDVVLFYLVSSTEEVAYRDIFQEAKSWGFRVFATESRALRADVISKVVPDYAERTFYVSGPTGMVNAAKRLLGELHVSRRKIRTDHFSGY